MKFKVVNHYRMCNEKNTVYLLLDSWDDWFTYSTLFNVFYVNDDGDRIRLYGVKIGQKNQGRSPLLPDEFNQLNDNYFSLGASVDYYENLKTINPNGDFREKILISLNDIAYDLDKYEMVKEYDVTKVSLMRDKTESMIKGQYHRMATGGARLTDYTFSFIPTFENQISNIELRFEVIPESMPPTNIHVLIGKNGVGKTTILKKMLCTLECSEMDNPYGHISTSGWNDFANIVFVSFSAFDKYVSIENQIIPYLYIGLVKEKSIKGFKDLSEEFADSFYQITQGSKKKLWLEAIKILESDNTFTELNIKSWSDVNLDDSVTKELISEYKKEENETNSEYKKRIQRLRLAKDIIPKYINLSSGHKVILLTVAKLIDTVEEKTLVLIDEPEEHLHPPLVSAFIRSLSNLLVYRNGVGIVATHSPVIVQEVPRSCVWILRRSGIELVADRPEIETFGENLGILTSEIFGYEVTNSGFHNMINKVAIENKTYESAIRSFQGNLGDEGKTILRSLMHKKEQTKDNNDD